MLVGVKWGALRDETKADLLEKSFYNGTGKVIVDSTENLSVAEAAKEWRITEGAIRKAISNKKFISGVDYRKAGRITLISKEAMERVYGKQEKRY